MPSLLKTAAARWTAALAGLALLAALPAAAEHMRFWRQTSYEDFEKGTPKGVALRSDGKLVPAPKFATLADPGLAYVWALAADHQGRIYAGGGSTAKVVRIDGGKVSTVFDSPELIAQALALDAQDNLYVGTSPDGKVYRVTPGGEKSVFFDPQRKYIWALAFGRDGVLYVGTGDKGEIFAVTADGKGQLYYKTEETHVRSLAVDTAGRLFAGTEPNGLVLRIDAAEPAGSDKKKDAKKDESNRAARGFVIYETAKKEVTALLPDAQGNLFAAAVGDKAPSIGAPQPLQPQPQVQMQGGVGPVVTFGVAAQPVVQTPFLPFPALGGGSEVYRFGADGAPLRLWTSRDELVYSLALSSEGKLVLGTGGRGIVYQIEGNEVFANIAKTFSGQVTCFAAGANGQIVAGTANPGKVFTLGPGAEPEGSYESQVFDAKLFSTWGRLTWWGDNGSTDGHVSFYMRSGNTSDPNNYWSAWAGPFKDPNGEPSNLPPGRFVQWKAVFHDGAPGINIAWVSVAYLPKNTAPLIDSIVMQNPGVRASSGMGVTPPGQAQSVQLRMPPPPPLPGVNLFPQPPQPQPMKFEAPPQGYAQRGWQSVLWGAHDDNDDEMVYAVYYRGEGETVWKLLKDKIEAKFYSWDTTTMPDGAYYLKIVASDAPSNPPEEALTAERVGDRFLVDNTPPDIANLRATVKGTSADAQFDAKDPASVLSRAEWSLDGGEWKIVLPAGRLSDSRQASYSFTLTGLAPGEHTLAVRLTDEYENQSAAKTVFRVSGAPAK